MELKARQFTENKTREGKLFCRDAENQPNGLFSKKFMRQVLYPAE